MNIKYFYGLPIFMFLFLVGMTGHTRNCKKNESARGFQFQPPAYSLPPLKDSTLESEQAIISVEKVPIISIGKQTWMKYDVNVLVYRNGEPISRFTNAAQLNSLSNKEIGAAGMIPSSKGDTTVLYNYYSIMDDRGICPEGFRIPELDDFFELLDTLYQKKYLDQYGSLEDIFNREAEPGFYASRSGWCCMDFTDEDGTLIDFANQGSNTAYWSSTLGEDQDEACSLEIGGSWRNDSDGVFYSCYNPKSWALSVRCIKE